MGERDGARAPERCASGVVPVGRAILLVDDHKLLLRALTRSLEWDGYLVEPFGDPVVALGVFAADPRRFGMVITDMEMPGLNGAAFAMRLRTLRREIPIVLYSGRVERSLGVVFDDTVDKCAPVEVLLQTVARFVPPAKSRAAASGG